MMATGDAVWNGIESRPQDGSWFLTCSPSGALSIARPIGPGDEGYEVAYGCDFDETDMPLWWMPIPARPTHGGEVS